MLDTIVTVVVCTVLYLIIAGNLWRVYKRWGDGTMWLYIWPIALPCYYLGLFIWAVVRLGYENRPAKSKPNLPGARVIK